MSGDGEEEIRNIEITDPTVLECLEFRFPHTAQFVSLMREKKYGEAQDYINIYTKEKEGAYRDG